MCTFSHSLLKNPDSKQHEQTFLCHRFWANHSPLCKCRLQQHLQKHDAWNNWLDQPELTFEWQWDAAWLFFWDCAWIPWEYLMADNIIITFGNNYIKYKYKHLISLLGCQNNILPYRIIVITGLPQVSLRHDVTFKGCLIIDLPACNKRLWLLNLK